MVPLPGKAQRSLIEVIGSDNAQPLACADPGIFRHPAIDPQHRPASLPPYRNQIGNAPHCAAIAKEQRIPLPMGGINQASLSNTGVLQHHPALPRASDALCAVAELRAHASPGPGDQEDVVHAVDLVNMCPFRRKGNVGSGNGTAVGDDHLVQAAGLNCCGIRGQLQHPDVAAPMD